MKEQKGDERQLVNKIEQEAVAQYLLAEFQMLHQRAAQQEENINSKVNFYLVSVSAVTGGIFVLSDSQSSNIFFMPLVLLVLLLILFIGITTFVQILDLVVSTTFFYRRAGRVRQYFLDSSPSSLKYFPFVVADDRPKFLPDRALRGVESILILLNAGVGSALMGIICYLWVAPSFSGRILISCILCVVSLGLLGYVQLHYARRYMQSCESREYKSNKIFFPGSIAKRYQADNTTGLDLEDEK